MEVDLKALIYKMADHDIVKKQCYWYPRFCTNKPLAFVNMNYPLYFSSGKLMGSCCKNVRLFVYDVVSIRYGHYIEKTFIAAVVYAMESSVSIPINEIVYQTIGNSRTAVSVITGSCKIGGKEYYPICDNSLCTKIKLSENFRSVSKANSKHTSIKNYYIGMLKVEEPNFQDVVAHAMSSASTLISQLPFYQIIEIPYGDAIRKGLVVGEWVSWFRRRGK